MTKWFAYEILRPLSQRLATAAGAALTSAGLQTDDISLVVAAIPAVVGIAADLLIRRLY